MKPRALNPRQQRFYVYALADPRDGAVFYVGKGCGRRAYTHESLARLWAHGDLRVAEKIRAILARGDRPIVTKLSSELTEEQAFERERHEIGTCGGLHNLSPGGRSHEESVRDRMRAVIKRLPRMSTLRYPAERSFLLDILKAAAREFARPTPTGWIEGRPPWPDRKT